MCLCVCGSVLSTYLPYPVNLKEKEGNAKWNAKKETLAVTLPIIRSDLFM